MKAPDGILIIDDFLDQDSIEKLKYFADGEIGFFNKEEITVEVKDNNSYPVQVLYTKALKK